MKMKRLFAQILALALCAALLCPVAAFAEGEEESASPAEPESYAVVDPAALQKLVEDYVQENGLNKDKISVGYCYLDTGDAWLYNGDRWYFSGGLHRIPLMMLLAEREYNGELTRDSELKGMTLGQAEESVLIYNSNDTTHAMMNVIGSDRECRNAFKQYSPLPDSYYNSDFVDYNHFTARFTLDVLMTLYRENERFPNILECMQKAAVGDYFGAGLGGDYAVAQRFGEYPNPEVLHDAGVIYTPHPFALVVMTQDMGLDQRIMKDMAVLFKDYTLTLDAAYEDWAALQAPQPETPAPEEQPTEGGFPVILPGEGTPGTNQGAGDGLIVPAAPDEGEADREQGSVPAPAAENLTPEEQAQRAAESSRRTVVVVLGAAALLILILSAVLRTVMRKKRVAQTENDTTK